MSPTRMVALLSLVALPALACTDYQLNTKGDPVVVDEDSATEAVDTAVAGDTAPPADTGEATTDVPLVPCDSVSLETLEWWGSQPIADAADPVDSPGRSYVDPAFEMVGWSTVALPDSGHTPSGTDRAYRGWLHLDAVPGQVFVDLQSDDGLWLAVNGAEVGHWGGDWQQEGCVNSEGGCSVTTTVAPVEITAFLVPGDNLVAARASNAVMNSYFQLHARCPG